MHKFNLVDKHLGGDDVSRFSTSSLLERECLLCPLLAKKIQLETFSSLGSTKLGILEKIKSSLLNIFTLCIKKNLYPQLPNDDLSPPTLPPHSPSFHLQNFQ